MSPRAVPRFHRDRRHPSSPGRGRDRSCATTTRSPTRVTIVAPRLAQPGEIVRVDGTVIGSLLVVEMGDRARSFPGLRVGLDDPQEDHPDPRESLQNMDSLLQAGRIPCFRLLSRRQLGPLAQQRERHDPGDLAALAIGRGAGVRRGMVLGVVLGEDEGLPADVQYDFRASGLYHLLRKDQ